MPNPPQASIWLDVPDDCRMQAEFTGDLDIQITFGDWGNGPQNVLFEREALERFVTLAQEILSAELPEDRKADLPVIQNPAPTA